MTHVVTAAEMLKPALQRAALRILSNDRLVRIGQSLPDGDTAVHQMRVGCRRMRSDLRTFGKLCGAQWAHSMREELSWLAGLLGPVRDNEVLRERLRAKVGLDAPDVSRLDGLLRRRETEAGRALTEGMRHSRYRALTQLLTKASVKPGFNDSADKPAARVVPALVAKPCRELLGGRSEDLHELRIRVKRARYAVEAALPLLGDDARRLARTLAGAQETLGEYHDAMVAAEIWRDLAVAHPDLAFTAGRLFERELFAALTAQHAFTASATLSRIETSIAALHLDSVRSARAPRTPQAPPESR